MKATINAEIVKIIEGIVNHGNKAVIQRSGTGVIVMEEKRQIRYRDTEAVQKPGGSGQR